ncbi:MAG TPA: SxtJ family membrane protein [Candidatus Binataceae bacterium]|nr:SxtJ family membrane protein [Candidatus Binataceae bacterium]
MAAGNRSGLDGQPASTASELRHFGFLLGVLIVIVFFGIPLLRRHAIVMWPWLAAIALWIPALVAPHWLHYPQRGWATLGEALGWLNTRVILSLVYFIAVLPIGMMMRLMGRDPMQRKPDAAASSYRVASKQRRSTHLEQPF